MPVELLNLLKLRFYHASDLRQLLRFFAEEGLFKLGLVRSRIHLRSL